MLKLFLGAVSLAAIATATTTTTTSVDTSFSHTSEPTGLADLRVDNDPENVNCYGNCYGVERAQMVDAINWFCQWAGTGTWTTSQNNKTDWWHYTASARADLWGNYEEGEIELQIGVTEEECDPSYTLDFNGCWEAFHQPLDGCDTQGQHSKHGGTYNPQPCLQFLLQPNSKFWPECQRGSCDLDNSCTPSLSGSAAALSTADDASAT